MKKIFLLMLIMGAFSPLINAYEYYISEDLRENVAYKFVILYDESNQMIAEWIRSNGTVAIRQSVTSNYVQQNLYPILNSIRLKHNNNPGYISNEQFKEYYTNDALFLNDLYLKVKQPFLNYLYNNNNFSSSNYINYDNYELLYNKDGLAVESIVNGKWAGLYDDNEKQFSGKLYGADGGLMYNNGEQVNYIQMFLERLISKFDTTLIGVFWIMGSVAGFGFIAYCVIDTLIFILNIGVNVFTGLKYGKVNWW